MLSKSSSQLYNQKDNLKNHHTPQPYEQVDFTEAKLGPHVTLYKFCSGAQHLYYLLILSASALLDDAE